MSYLSQECDKAESKLAKGNLRGAFGHLEHAFYNTHFAESREDFDRLETLLKQVAAQGDSKWGQKADKLLPLIAARRERWENPVASPVERQRAYEQELEQYEGAGTIVVRQCLLLGGYGYSIANDATYDLLFGETELRVTNASVHPDGLVIDMAEITDLDLGGPGAVTEGGGFIGGGFGAQGAIEGMGIAAALNALTTRTKVITIIGIQWRAGEAIFHHASATPERLRLALSRVFGQLRHQGRPASVSPVDELERLVALHERGLLTVEEFAAAKAKLLAL